MQKIKVELSEADGFAQVIYTTREYTDATEAAEF